MWLKHHKKLIGKILLLLVVLILLASGPGCVQGLQPIGWSGGVIDGNTLFVGSKEGKLVSIDIANSARRWSEPLKTITSSGGFGCAAGVGGCGGSPTGVAIYSTPAVAGDLVYISGYNGKIYAFDAAFLQRRWMYPAEGEGYLKPIVGGPVVDQGKVYFGDSGGKVYALWADTERGDNERVVWEEPFQTGDKIWASPAVDSDTLYIGSFDKKLYALNAATGDKKWEFETEGAITSTPLVYNNTVYFGSFDRYLYAVDATDGSLKWKFMTERWLWATPVIYDDTIYAPCLDGRVYILDAENGHELTEAINMESSISSSPVIVDSLVIMASQEGKIYALDTADNQLTLLADLEEAIDAPLCASDGIIYIHAPDLIIHPVDASTGAQLTTISLKSGE